ncbi:hypothetical protein BerOc1_01248 [Pseudodesulfovibrio hydrargyri]|uniref:Uncharacterized protein n=1 Tax=Pseudodesulfovibrio hydrargyri TaxID=2125990 RepID=A0A1J5N107_9BACT|nr:hypothetical protein BerOc1_01248 [Pseudodesulfovibrio hydrargyri]
MLLRAAKSVPAARESRRAGCARTMLHALPAGSIFLLAQKNRRKKGPGGWGGRPESGRQEADPLGSTPESRLAALAPIRRAAVPRGQLLTSRSRADLGEGKRYDGTREGVLRLVSGRVAVGRKRPSRFTVVEARSCRVLRQARRPGPIHSCVGQQSAADPRARLRRRSAYRIESAQQASIRAAKAAYGLLGPLPPRSHHSAVFASFFLRQQKRKSP